MRVVSVCAVLTALVSCALANEWATSRDQFCIERCVLKEKKGREVYVCQTVDGVNKEFRSGNRSASSRPSMNAPIPALDNDDFPWDYCTPSHTIGLSQEDDAESEPLPRPVNKTQGGSGYNDGSDNESNFGGGGYNSGNKVSTSFPGVKCSGPCRKASDLAYKCVPEGSGDNFYCSPDIPLERQQITSHNKLWCMDRCEATNAGDHKCRTLFGYDQCSPVRGYSTKKVKCTGKCQMWPETEHNFLACKIDEFTYEPCGDWDASDKTEALEFTQEHKVCAGPCMDHDGEMLCTYAEWKLEGTDEDPVSILYMNEGNCGPDTGMNWTLIGIILGAVVGAVIIIGIIGVVISRKSGYRQAATN